MVLQNFYLIGKFLILQVFHIIFKARLLHTHRTLKNMLFKQKGGEKYGILMTPKEKLAQALFTLNFLDLRLHHTKTAATVYYQSTTLSW